MRWREGETGIKNCEDGVGLGTVRDICSEARWQFWDEEVEPFFADVSPAMLACWSIMLKGGRGKMFGKRWMV